MMMKGRNVMRSVNVDKQELLRIVNENAQKHKDDYLESIKDYKIAVQKVAKENLAISKLPIEDHKFKSFPQPPRSYDVEYNRAIRMLELSIDDNISLEENIFNQLVLDEWDWKASFVAGNMFYKTLT